MDPHEKVNLPAIEGLLVGRRRQEYVIALPQLIVAADAKPVTPQAQLLEIPRERVAWFEVLQS